MRSKAEITDAMLESLDDIKSAYSSAGLREVSSATQTTLTIFLIETLIDIRDLVSCLDDHLEQLCLRLDSNSN